MSRDSNVGTRASLRAAMRLTAVVAVLFVVAGYLLRAASPVAESGQTLTSELGSALLGAAVNAVAAAMIAFMALSSALQRRRQQKVYARMREETARTHSLVVGAMRIPHVIIVAAVPRGLDVQSIVFDFEPLDPELPPRLPVGWEALREDRLVRLKAEAAKNSVPFTDDPAVDLASAGITELRRSSPQGVTRYSLTPRLTSYHVWAATSARLDDGLSAAERAELPGEGETLRERFAQTPRRLEDVGTLPTPAKVGVGVVVVTSDGQMVLGLRGKTWVASHHDTPGEVHRAPVHFVAEGMSPDDLDERGRLSPFETARRGMLEELGLGGSSRGTGQVVSLRQVGVFFDSQRWQPCFAHVAHVDRSFDELLTLVTSARDFWEADQLLAVPFDLDNPMTRDLMLGRHQAYVFASNHAHALSYFALLDEFGLEHMLDAMRSRGAWRTKAGRSAPLAAGRQRTPL